MTREENSRDSFEKERHRLNLCGGTNGGLFCGILIIASGLVWIGKKAGFIPPEFSSYFWPLLVMLLGAWMILSAVLKKTRRT